MNKLEILEHVHSTIEPARREQVAALLYGRLLSRRKKALLLRQAGQSTLIEAEIILHWRNLDGAQEACSHGLAGTIPDDWDSSGWLGEYDAHKEIIGYLDAIPYQQLSDELLAHIDQLPDKQTRDYGQSLYHLKTISPILSNPLGDVSNEDIAREIDNFRFDNLEATFFTDTYATALAQARTLAEKQGDFQEIQKYLT